MKQSAVNSKLLENKQIKPSILMKSTRDFVKENKKLQGSIRKKQSPIRLVTAFTIQSQQKNTETGKPLAKSSSNFERNQAKWNRFRMLYDNGHLPVQLEQRGIGKSSRSIRWLEDPKNISAERFVDLLPYDLVAEQGVLHLLKNHVDSESVKLCLPQLVLALNAMLLLPETAKKKMALIMIIQLARIPQCGPALVPHYRHLIRPLFMLSNKNAYDMEYKQGKSVEEYVEVALNTLEKTGYPKAFQAIKSIIPTYESCMKDFCTIHS
uniref:Uncharacterized protein n=1 Tax=Setaria digitata TaxID=48799 RepID=A0A915PSK1_9BILA